MLTTLQLVEPTRLDGSKFEGRNTNDENEEEILLWRVTSTFTGSSLEKHKQEQILTVETTAAPASTSSSSTTTIASSNTTTMTTTAAATTTTTAGYVPTASIPSALAPTPPVPPLPIATATPLSSLPTTVTPMALGSGIAEASSAAAAVSGLHNHALLHHHQHHHLPPTVAITTPTPLHTTTTPTSTLSSLPAVSTSSPAPAPAPVAVAPLPPTTTTAGATNHHNHHPTSSPFNATTPSTTAATTVVPPVSGMMMGSGPGGVTEVLLVPPPEFYRVNHPLQGITIEADKVVQALATLWPQLSSTAKTGPDLDRIIKCLANPETFTLYLATHVSYVSPTVGGVTGGSDHRQHYPTTTGPPAPVPGPAPLVPAPTNAMASPTLAPSNVASSSSSSPSPSPSSGLKIQEIVGTMTLVSLNLLMSTRAHIEDLVVSKAYRGLGIGKALMQRAIHDAVNIKKCNIIDLTSKPDRVQARQLYESLGFKIRDTGAYRYYAHQ
ncbi:hypothetical protein BGW41_005691 [Actinomortierella wolfii]|nr:hypothetical protein BGW41_005691 [Actinomortierella wolfii]